MRTLIKRAVIAAINHGLINADTTARLVELFSLRDA